VTISSFFHRMDPITFQDFCVSLLLEINGINIEVGSRGADGGRDALYEGPLYIHNNSPKLFGKWLIQIKHHNIDTLSNKDWNKVILKDLRTELNKLKNKGFFNFDSYLFITNIPSTWVSVLGTFDQIKAKFEPKFIDLGLKYFIIFDGNKLRGLLPLVPLTEKYFNPQKPLDQASAMLSTNLNKMSTIDKNFNSALRQLNTTGVIKLNISRKNPHILVDTFWEHGKSKTKFYLVNLTTKREITIVFDIHNKLFSNEILCIHGSKSLIEQLNGRINFLPIETNLSQKEIIKRVSQFNKYLTSEQS